MEYAFTALVGVLFTFGCYLVLSRLMVRILIGFALIGNAVNLLLFTVGRLTREAPPIIGATEKTLAAGSANPLPQALILTAIVISFSFFAFLLVLVGRAYTMLKTDDADELAEAEPPSAPAPSLDY